MFSFFLSLCSYVLIESLCSRLPVLSGCVAISVVCVQAPAGDEGEKPVSHKRPRAGARARGRAKGRVRETVERTVLQTSDHGERVEGSE